MRRLLSLACAALILAAAATPALAAPGGQSADNATMWYLSLGDSLAAGVQPTGPGTSAPSNEGYAEQLLAIARADGMKVGLIKLGCSGETTVTFTQGGICAYDEGSQLAQALVFIKAHRDKLAFITIDLGWNDFDCDESAPDPLGCIPPGLVSVQQHLLPILQQLRAAAPDVPIVGATLYDPFLALWLQPGKQALADLSVVGITQVNAFVTGLYALAQMPVADVQGAFGTTDTTPTSVILPWGPMPQNVANICALTWMCTARPDVHANAAGYHVMAEAFWAALPH